MNSLDAGSLDLAKVRRSGATVRIRPETATTVWSWAAVTLAALFFLKLVMILSQGESLYELHWRVSGMRPSWVNYLAFYAFMLLGALGLVSLARECRTISLRSVRMTNALVVFLGLSFIFLTFHNGDKNLVYPVLSGVLRWTSLVPYVANSVFFNQPFLAAWLFVYAASYYVLARTGRESLVLFLTAGFGLAYGLIYFQEFLLRRNELLVADSVGCASLIMAARAGNRSQNPKQGLGLGWLVFPLAWTLFFGWALLRFDDQWTTHSAQYLYGLIGFSMVLFTTATWLIRRAGNPLGWGWWVLFFFAGFFFFANSNYPVSVNYDHLLCLAATFPRYIAGGLVVVGMFGTGAFLCRKIKPTASLWWLHAGGLFLIVASGANLRLTQIMGVPLSWDLLSFGDSPKMMLRMSKPYLPGALLGLIGIVIAYALALRWLRNHVRRGLLAPEVILESVPGGPGAAQHDRLRTPASSGAAWMFPKSSPGLLYVGLLAACLGALGWFMADSDKAEDQAVLRLIRTSPLWKRVTSRRMGREEFLRSAAALGLGNFETAINAAPGGPPRDLNVLLVFMESSYNKHLSLFGSSEDTQPLLTKYKNRMELFPNFFSAFTGSIHARFATFTSLYPVRDFHSFTQERIPVKSLFEALHDQGYTCSMFYSSYFDYTGFRDFLKNRGLDEIYDADTMPGQRSTPKVSWGLMEEETSKAIRGQLQRYAQGHQKFCLTYVPAAPHYPYDSIPKAFQKYKLAELGDFTPLYLNELLYMDSVIASILDELKQLGLLDHTLVVITNDHGEMLGGKDGHLGHGWKVTPQLANTPLILMDPDRPGFQINKTIGTQVDLLPTVLERLHLPIPAGQLYEGLSLDAGAERSGHLGYLNSYKQFGILSGNHVLLGDREANDPSGVASSGAVFTIANDGARTLFSQAEMEGTIQQRQSDMARFDAFQENLLRNYSSYCAELKANPH